MARPLMEFVHTMCWSCALKHYQRLADPPVLAHRAYATTSSTRRGTAGDGSFLARSQDSHGRLRHGERHPQSDLAPRRRQYHATPRSFRTAQHAHSSDHRSSPPPLRFTNRSPDTSHKSPITVDRDSKIRQELRLWDQLYGRDEEKDIVNDDMDKSETVNNMTRLGDTDSFESQEEIAQGDRDDFASMTKFDTSDMEDLDPHHRFLRRGDLVELEYPRSERESILAVFVRRIGIRGDQCQFYTVNGRWANVQEKQVQYVVPGYMEEDLIKRIVPHLPDEEVTKELLEKAAMFDLSVPREISAPIVSRLTSFQRESLEMYRKHASTLDNAHEILSHPTDLKFGSLEQVATRLLGKPSEKSHSPAALFTIRKALRHAGFAFGTDRRSHRLTGFLQIRSKDQVQMVSKVRQWIRDWQDELATGKTSTAKQRFETKGANILHDFIEKARRLIEESRKLREPTDSGNVGISKIRYEIKKDQQAVKHIFSEFFTDEEREVVRFMEGWSCSNIFLGLPRLESLPPLLLQATGMYDDQALNTGTGFMFLQEIGLLLPYENRVRFDQNLLLPSSQHSRPLEMLMGTILGMKETHGFTDSMSELRHDWGPGHTIFCIDGEGAHEIDDGLSIEPAENDDHWVHMHIANPTAYFDNNHAVAKMARHLTETIYMPERAYRMLPQWATSTMFSLANGRPCLTFSARLNPDGEIMDYKITPGTLRSVVYLSPSELSKSLGQRQSQSESMSLLVGGKPPSQSPGRKLLTADELRPKQKQSLRTMQGLAVKRQAIRRAGGGIFFAQHDPSINVWMDWRKPGLEWAAPSRVRARFVEGDPIIQYRSKELVSSYSSNEGENDILVREMMLLACEIAGKWCAERNIPMLYRGTIPRPDTLGAATFYDKTLRPAMERSGGEAPMHLAFEYLRQTGATALTTEPLYHQVLGLSHYGKVTSPLRRYGDMLQHWQIEAALREEARLGRSLRGSKGHKFLPFSVANLKQVSVGLQPREAMIRRAGRYAEDCWTVQLLFRAYYYGECELPETFSAYVYSPPSAQYPLTPVMLKEYCLNASMLKPEDRGPGSEARVGDMWQVKIVKIDLFHRIFQVEPLHLVSRWAG